MKTYIVYKYTNLCNNKVYIGQTCQTLSDRAGKNGAGYQGCTYFYHAIQKYGWQNFISEILVSGLSKEDANIQERYYIQLYRSQDPEFGYNILEGGQGGERSCGSLSPEETAKKHSEAMVKRWSDPAYRDYFSASVKHFYQDENNQEKIKQMQEKKKGQRHPRSKPVVCKETGQIFPCLREAAVWCGMSAGSAGNIGSQITGKRTSAGVHPVTKEPLHWQFLNEEDNSSIRVSMKGKKIQNLDTGEQFDSITQASQQVGISTATIRKSCDSNGQIGVRGYKSKYDYPTHWVFLE